mmetsp:Transcript_34777/g.56137  ORF Transcript_34777/g.56137 Transcript_34777/m.56137 type:complete len:100 (-) Transcript_34777:42-341(-)
MHAHAIPCDGGVCVGGRTRERNREQDARRDPKISSETQISSKPSGYSSMNLYLDVLIYTLLIARNPPPGVSPLWHGEAGGRGLSVKTPTTGGGVLLVSS